MVRKRNKLIFLSVTTLAVGCLLLVFQCYSTSVHYYPTPYLERDLSLIQSFVSNYQRSHRINDTRLVVHNASEVTTLPLFTGNQSMVSSERSVNIDEMFNHLSSISVPKTKTIAEILDQRTRNMRTDQFSYYSNREFELTKQFLIDQPYYCGKHLGKNVDLMVVVMSAVYKFSQRDAIRKTWGKVVLERRLKLLFFVAKSEDGNVNALIAKENSVYNDIIQAAFVDHYYNNTLKAISTLHSLKVNCPKVRYVLKSDDDMLLNVQIAIDFAKINHNYRKTIFGLIYKNAVVNRSKTSKWFVPKYVFPYPHYPSYATGAVYMFTGDSIAPLLSESVKPNAFYVDDVFVTGVVAQKVGVKRIQANNFVKLHYANKLDAWTFATYLGTHGYDAKLMVQRWTAIHRHIGCQ